MFTGRLAAVSNRQTWIEQVSLTDEETDTAIDLTGHAIVVEVRSPGTSQALLTASTSNGAVTFPSGESAGIFQFLFTEAQMDDLCAGRYEVGVTDEIDSVTTQLMIVTVDVLDGVVK